jgi:hypothetical protein
MSCMQPCLLRLRTTRRSGQTPSPPPPSHHHIECICSVWCTPQTTEGKGSTHSKTCLETLLGTSTPPARYAYVCAGAPQHSSLYGTYSHNHWAWPLLQAPANAPGSPRRCPLPTDGTTCTTTHHTTHPLVLDRRDGQPCSSTLRRQCHYSLHTLCIRSPVRLLLPQAGNTAGETA